ncbi:MAG: polyprenol monophosphomannose synthase [Candidatus Dormibacteraceae bacterium]
MRPIDFRPALTTPPALEAILSGHRTLAIIPTYNERENLGPLLQELRQRCPALSMLVVDDASPDGTGQLADEIAIVDPAVHVLHRTGKRGLGAAYIDGFRWALAHDFDRVIEMDADFSHRPQDLPALLGAAVGQDLVIGSRNIPGGAVVGWSRLRQLISRGGSWYARALLGLPVRDCTSGFKCFSRLALESLDLQHVRSNGYGFQVEINHACHRAGLRITEVPIVFPERARGSSKMSFDIVVEAALVVVKLKLGLYPAAILSREPRSTASMSG